MSTALDLTRTNTLTGAVYSRTGISFKDAQQAVAYCATDNLNFSRKAASDAASALKVGEPLMVGPYSFLATRA